MKDPGIVKDPEAVELVHKFEKLQEERVLAYSKLDQGHKTYLNTGPNYEFLPYKDVVHEVTQQFKQISEKINEIKNELKSKNATTLANFIEEIQNSEMKKLELTTHLQLTKQMVAETPHGDLEKEKERDIQKELNRVVEEIIDNLYELRYETTDE